MTHLTPIMLLTTLEKGAPNVMMLLRMSSCPQEPKFSLHIGNDVGGIDNVGLSLPTSSQIWQALSVLSLANMSGSAHC